MCSGWATGRAGSLGTSPAPLERLTSASGDPPNGPEPLYAGIEDSAGRIAEAVRATEWQKWHIALAEVRAAGVDVAAVKKMVIGVGDRKDPKPGGTGRIYIDDIRLTKRMP